MGIHEHVDKLMGKPVREYDPERGIKDPGGTVYRLSIDWDAKEEGATLMGLLAQFLDDPKAAKVSGLIIGPWEELFDGTGGSDRIVPALVTACDRLSSLRGLFFGDIIAEECEISWIQQTDVSPLLHAYPKLEYFRVRGGTGLVLGTLDHQALKVLIIESGGLDAEVVRSVGRSKLPRLEHLELWLGSANYGATTTVADFAPILKSGRRFPRLSYLGLRDCEIADAVAVAVAKAPVLKRIQVLDLSLGNLTDEGAKALLESRWRAPETRHPLSFRLPGGSSSSWPRWALSSTPPIRKSLTTMTESLTATSPFRSRFFVVRLSSLTPETRQAGKPDRRIGLRPKAKLRRRRECPISSSSAIPEGDGWPCSRRRWPRSEGRRQRSSPTST